MRCVTGLGAVLVCTSVIFAGIGENPHAAARLTQAYPGVQLLRENGQLARVWGTEFSFGLSPVDSATAFVESFADLYGLTSDELAPGNPRDGALTQSLGFRPGRAEPRFTLVYYTQQRGGLPVYGGELRLLVRNEANFPLVLAAANTYDLGDFQVPADAESNVNFAAAQAAALAAVPGLLNFTEYALVVWPDAQGKPRRPRVAIVFDADNGMPAMPEYEKYRFVADAVTGQILEQENRILDVDVTGSVHGMATSIPKADACNPEVDTVMKYAQVSIGSTIRYTDANGNFVIPNGGSSPVTVTSPIGGQYFDVFNQGGSNTVLTLTVTPPGPANFMHNAANNSEYNRAEVNGYIQANIARDFALAQNPAYPVIYNQLNFPVNVNINDDCNAYYDYASINFFRALGGCNNTGFSNVIHHEYGHHLVDSGGSGQGAYGEGMSDCIALLISDTPKCAVGFYAGDCVDGIRNADNTLQYPCSGEIHYCGQLLSGCVWSTRNELIVTEPANYLAILSNLTVDSILLHTGTSITPAIYTDFITLDGGAHFDEITAGFAAHSMVPAPPPSNDNCAAAEAACPGQTYTGSTQWATDDGTASCGSSSSTPDVWYTYTPASSGSATFSLCGSGTSYDSVLSIRTACAGSELNCNDDGCGGYSAPSTITRNVTGGTTYWIRISGYSGATGPYALTITGPACQASNYTLTTAVNPSGSGTITLNPPGGSYAPGTVVTVTANNNTGYHFVNWSGDLSGSTNPTTITMNGNKSITANFALNTYTLTTSVAPANSGTITLNPPGGTYTHGTTVSLTANPATGFHFNNWSGDLSGSSNPTTILMNGPKTVQANFGLNTYTLTITISGQGTVLLNPPGGTYTHGTNVQLTADPADEWMFDHWSGDLSGNTNPISIQMNGPRSVGSTFLPDCNGNGVPDAQDIAGGAWDDNANGVPDVCEQIPGDMNCDDVVNFADLNPFVLVVTDPSQYLVQYPSCIRLNGDCNGDGVVNFADINAFVVLLSR